MQPVVLISDSNYNDIYISVLKYHITSLSPKVSVFEYLISGEQSKNNINQTAAYILLNEHAFPENTIFYVEINIAEQIPEQKILLIQYNRKWIFTPDNGLIGLLEKEKIQKIFYWKESINTTFYSKNEMLNGLRNLLMNAFSVRDDFKVSSFENCRKLHWPLVMERQKSDNEKHLIIPILYIDSFENIILNFKKTDYEKYSEQYDITIKLPIAQKKIIHSTYNRERNSEVVVMFNDAGYVELAINDGRLASLVAEKNIYSETSYYVMLILKPKQ